MCQSVSTIQSLLIFAAQTTAGHKIWCSKCNVQLRLEMHQ